MIRLERSHIDRKREVEVETKEELLKSINQIIVTIQNIELEIGNDPELCRALTKQRYAEENFKSKLLVAKRHAFTKLRTRILLLRNIRKFAKKRSVQAANRTKRFYFSHWGQFCTRLKKIIPLQARSKASPSLGISLMPVCGPIGAIPLFLSLARSKALPS